MNVPPYRFSVSGKAVWGRAILGALFAMLLLPAGSEASGPQHGKSQSALRREASLSSGAHRAPVATAAGDNAFVTKLFRLGRQ